MYTVKLTYFKEYGKYYSEDSYKTDKVEMFQIFDEVRDLLKRRRLPGLVAGHSHFIVLVEVPDHPMNYPALVYDRDTLIRALTVI